MAGLTFHELAKRDNLKIFTKKVLENQPFEVAYNKRHLLKRAFVYLNPTTPEFICLRQYTENPSEENLFALQGLLGKNFYLRLLTKDNTEIFSGFLLKTPEFGGLSCATVYKKERWHHGHLQKTLNQATVFGLRPITLHIQTSAGKIHTFLNVKGIRLLENKTKADFEFLDKDENVLFRVSHKDGNDAKHFLQWSGVKSFENHPEVLSFGEDIKKYLRTYKGWHDKDTFPKRLSVGREIKDTELKKAAIFGNEGEVDFLIQGSCNFASVGNFEFRLSSNNPIVHRSESLEFLPEKYSPVFLAKRSDHKRWSFGIPFCRGMIYPKGGRLFHVFI